jgi:hypothetical protein
LQLIDEYPETVEEFNARMDKFNALLVSLGQKVPEDRHDHSAGKGIPGEPAESLVALLGPQEE